MKKTLGLVVAVLAVLTVAVFLGAGALRTSAVEQNRYFPQTGHSLSGRFLDYYDSFPDAESIFGYPITEAFQDKRCQGGALCQFFQRALFTLQEDQVVLASLGVEYYASTGGASGAGRKPLTNLLPVNTVGCRIFRSKLYGAHPVCYEFLPFYERHRALLGRVVSDPLMENGVPVQYFEGARLEYRATAIGNMVVVSDLGEWYFNRVGLPISLLNPVRSHGNAPRVLNLSVATAVEKVVLGRGQSQTVYVAVLDQVGMPVSGAQVVVLVGRMPKARGYTDAKGLWSGTFAAPDKAGDFEVRTTVDYAGMNAVGYTSFRVWP